MPQHVAEEPGCCVKRALKIYVFYLHIYTCGEKLFVCSKIILNVRLHSIINMWVTLCTSEGKLVRKSYLYWFFTKHCKETIQKILNKFPSKGIVRPQYQFPHSCVCERFIYSYNQSAYSAAGKYVTKAAQFFFWEYINGIFVAVRLVHQSLHYRRAWRSWDTEDHVDFFFNRPHIKKNQR
jgi:hypothetical protein